MKRLLIVYCSTTGGTASMAKASANAARAEQGVIVDLYQAGEAGDTQMLAADGYIFATPETLAAIAGPMKDFFDRIYYGVLDRIAGRPYATLICAGSDGENAARQIARIAKGWRLRPVAEPIIVCTHAQTREAIMARKIVPESDLKRCANQAAALAAGLQMGIY